MFTNAFDSPSLGFLVISITDERLSWAEKKSILELFQHIWVYVLT